ncbi:hypothetical protein PIB30_017826 [Stylosanthes scabra]|uniref:Uncharacterized protein n=1 Tax=Stylosanthes scabra TaxID=79078 RepID=A0ABU6V753_9FABA|nr:hypothetical protein [Stylosanthes scabra]
MLNPSYKSVRRKRKDSGNDDSDVGAAKGEVVGVVSRGRKKKKRRRRHDEREDDQETVIAAMKERLALCGERIVGCCWSQPAIGPKEKEGIISDLPNIAPAPASYDR